MAATAAQIAQLRRMVAEPTSATYNDVTLTGYIEAHPLIDERGEAPYTWDTSTEPPTQEANDSWIATYDLNAAAADVWEEKAGALATSFDFEADGGSYKRSQAYNQAQERARFYRARRRIGATRLIAWPKIARDLYQVVGNLPEPD
jgi:hypothetical protein